MSTLASIARTGGPAFPCDNFAENGMYLRDYFAAQAMAALIAEPIEGIRQSVAFELGDGTTKMIADAAYKFADAMLKARKQ